MDMNKKLRGKYRPKKVVKNFELWCEQGGGCDWKLTVPFEDVYQWHNKPCPKCGKGVIVSDADINEVKHSKPPRGR